MKEYNIKRFIDAHQRSYGLALGEIRAGYKVSHWMWFIFPQIKGLGHSEIAEYYAIEDESNNAEEVMGWPDDLKLRSSMTLFAAADPANDIYQKVLDKFFEGKPDERTLELLRDQ